MESLDRLRVLNVDQLVELGIGSRATVYRMLKRGDIPCVQRGRSVRVRVTDLEAWLERGGSTANVVPFRRPKPTKKTA